MNRNERHHQRSENDAAPQQPTTYGVCPCPGERAQIILRTYPFLLWPAGLAGDTYAVGGRRAAAAASVTVKLLFLKGNCINGIAVNSGVLQCPLLPRHEHRPQQGRQHHQKWFSRVTPHHGPPPALPTMRSAHGAPSTDTSHDALHTELQPSSPFKRTSGG